MVRRRAGSERGELNRAVKAYNVERGERARFEPFGIGWAGRNAAEIDFAAQLGRKLGPTRRFSEVKTRYRSQVSTPSR